MIHTHRLRTRTFLFALALVAIVPLSAQNALPESPRSRSYADNEFQLLSRRYIRWAEEALNNGDFDASIEYSALARENADLSDAHVQKLIERGLAEKKIIRAETRLTWAEKNPVVFKRPEPAIVPAVASENDDDALAEDGGTAAETDDTGESDNAVPEDGDAFAVGEDDDALVEDNGTLSESEDGDAVTESDDTLVEGDESEDDTLAEAEDSVPEDDDTLVEGDNTIDESATVSFESADEVFAAVKEALAFAHNAFDGEDFKSAADHAQVALDALAWLSDDTGPWRIGDPGLPRYYVVRLWSVTGDCFWNISAKPFVYGTPWQWRRVYDANKERLITPTNPNRIAPGTVLEIPASPGEMRAGTYDSARK